MNKTDKLLEAARELVEYTDRVWRTAGFDIMPPHVQAQVLAALVQRFCVESPEKVGFLKPLINNTLERFPDAVVVSH